MGSADVDREGAGGVESGRSSLDQTGYTQPDEQWTADRIAELRCVVREDGKKSHVFLDYSNRCVCGDVDLNSYRDLVLI